MGIIKWVHDDPVWDALFADMEKQRRDSWSVWMRTDLHGIKPVRFRWIKRIACYLKGHSTYYHIGIDCVVDLSETNLPVECRRGNICQRCDEWVTR